MSFAYRPDLLEEYEASRAPDTESTPALQNDIHPLWKQDHFRMGGRVEYEARSLNGLQWDDPQSRMPDALYQTIQPALRLASMFLSHSRPFFLKVLRANEIDVIGVNVVARGGLLEDRQLLRCLDPEWVPSSDDETAYDQALGEIAEHFRAYCGDSTTSMIPGSFVWAMGSCTATPPIWSRIFLASELFDCFSSSRYHQFPMATRQRLLYFMACLMLHELAHVIGLKKKENYAIRNHVEPLFEPTDVTPELGHAWEIWFFAGFKNTIGSGLELKRFALHWHSSSRTPGTDDVYCIDCPYKNHLMRASAISRFFSTAGWEKHRDGSHPLTVELVPVRSLTCLLEEKRDENYHDNFRQRLEQVHRGLS